MPKDITPGKPSTRRYSQEEKDSAVRMVRTLRAELGTTMTVADLVRYRAEGDRCPVLDCFGELAQKPRVDVVDPAHPEFG